LAFSADGKPVAAGTGMAARDIANKAGDAEHFRPADFGFAVQDDKKVAETEKAGKPYGRGEERDHKTGAKFYPINPDEAPKGEAKGKTGKPAFGEFDTGFVQATQPAVTPRKIVIRSGDIEFEIESFDSAVATVTR